MIGAHNVIVLHPYLVVGGIVAVLILLFRACGSPATPPLKSTVAGGEADKKAQ